MAQKLLTWDKDLQAREKRLHSQEEAIADEKKELEERNAKLNGIQELLEQRLRQYKTAKDEFKKDCERLRQRWKTVEEREKQLLSGQKELVGRQNEPNSETCEKTTALETEEKIRVRIEQQFAEKETKWKNKVKRLEKNLKNARKKLSLLEDESEALQEQPKSSEDIPGDATDKECLKNSPDGISNSKTSD